MFGDDAPVSGSRRPTTSSKSCGKSSVPRQPRSLDEQGGGRWPRALASSLEAGLLSLGADLLRRKLQEAREAKEAKRGAGLRRNGALRAEASPLPQVSCLWNMLFRRLAGFSTGVSDLRPGIVAEAESSHVWSATFCLSSSKLFCGAPWDQAASASPSRREVSSCKGRLRGTLVCLRVSHERRLSGKPRSQRENENESS